MSGKIQEVKDKLNTAIEQLCKASWMFVKDPSRDFTRERKLPLNKLIAVLLLTGDMKVITLWLIFRKKS